MPYRRLIRLLSLPLLSAVYTPVRTNDLMKEMLPFFMVGPLKVVAIAEDRVLWAMSMTLCISWLLAMSLEREDAKVEPKRLL